MVCRSLRVLIYHSVPKRVRSVCNNMRTHLRVPYMYGQGGIPTCSSQIRGNMSFVFCCVFFFVCVCVFYSSCCAGVGSLIDGGGGGALLDARTCLVRGVISAELVLLLDRVC